MQIVSTGENLHEILNPVFWEKIKDKKFKMSSEIFTKHVKC